MTDLLGAGTDPEGWSWGSGPPPPPPPKYQTSSNLNTRTAHSPSTVRDGLRIAPDVRRLFVDRQEPEKLPKLPRYSNFGTVCCTGNFKHELFSLNFLFLCLLFENVTQITKINTQFNKPSLAEKF